MKILNFKVILYWTLFFYFISLSASEKYNKAITIKCQEITGTGKSDIFKIGKQFEESIAKAEELI